MSKEKKTGIPNPGNRTTNRKYVTELLNNLTKVRRKEVHFLLKKFKRVSKIKYW